MKTRVPTMNTLDQTPPIIAVFSGRPGGVSERATGEVLNRLGDIAHTTFSLSESSLFTCNACLRCMDDNSCVLRDGLSSIADAMRSAGGLIFAAPEYWEGIHAKARAFWERICFMGRHGGIFPFRHLKAVSIGVSGTGDSSAGLSDLRSFMEDARIELLDEIAVQGTYACFSCGIGEECPVSGLWDIFPRGFRPGAGAIPSLENQLPQVSSPRPDCSLENRFDRAAERLKEALST
jgi:hypothetical protein